MCCIDEKSVAGCPHDHPRQRIFASDFAYKGEMSVYAADADRLEANRVHRVRRPILANAYSVPYRAGPHLQRHSSGAIPIAAGFFQRIRHARAAGGCADDGSDALGRCSRTSRGVPDVAGESAQSPLRLNFRFVGRFAAQRRLDRAGRGNSRFIERAHCSRSRGGACRQPLAARSFGKYTEEINRLDAGIRMWEDCLDRWLSATASF